MTTTLFETRHAVTADGTRLGVHEATGVGNLVVALHGFTGDGTTMLPLLDRIRGGRPALAIDLVGHGISEAPGHLESYSMPSVVDQVLSIIGPHGPGSVHLVGYSMGGRVALSLAARAPWYFSSITTMSATPGIDDAAERAERHDRDLALATRLVDKGIDAFIDEWLDLPIFENYVANLSSTDLEHTRLQRRKASELGLANSLRGTGTGAMPPVWNMLKSIRSPILSLAGSLDQRYVEIARQIESLAHNAQFRAIDNAGHVVHIENLDQVGHLVAQFLQHCETNDQQGEPA